MKEKGHSQTTCLKDLYISSYLKARGFPLRDATVDDSGRVTFHFLETPELVKALRDYYTDIATVHPARFIESFKGLRSLAYTLSDSKKSMRGDHGEKTWTK